MRSLSSILCNHILSLLDKAIQHMKYQPRLEFPMLPCPGYTLDTTPSPKSLLVDAILSSLGRICTMLFNLLALGGLRMLSRWPKLFRMPPANPSQHTLCETG